MCFLNLPDALSLPAEIIIARMSESWMNVKSVFEFLCSVFVKFGLGVHCQMCSDA